MLSYSSALPTDRQGPQTARDDQPKTARFEAAWEAGNTGPATPRLAIAANATAVENQTTPTDQKAKQTMLKRPPVHEDKKDKVLQPNVALYVPYDVALCCSTHYACIRGRLPQPETDIVCVQGVPAIVVQVNLWIARTDLFADFLGAVRPRSHRS